MSNVSELSSSPVGADEARDLVLSLERSGLDSSRIHVDTTTPLTTEDMSRADQKAATRPGRRVAIGLGAGLILGLVLGFLVSAVADTSTAGTMLAVAIAGALLGGLFGLYSRLPMSTEVTDTDAASVAKVRVDISGLAESDVSEVAHRLRAR